MEIEKDDFFEDVRNLANQIRKKEKQDVDRSNKPQNRSNPGEKRSR